MKSRFLSIVFCVLFLAAAFLSGLQKQAQGAVKEGKTALVCASLLLNAVIRLINRKRRLSGLY